MKINLKSIGTIYTPYIENRDIPIQGIFKPDVEGYVQLDDPYISGLKDLEKFSHAILIYYFHHSPEEKLEGKPFLEDEKHGIFAIRSPHRPNHLGFSIVRIRCIQGNRIYFTEVDMLDGTPLLDIKPFVKYYDNRDDVVNGWVDKHFENGNIPKRTIIK